jgi:hypothetical protein
MCTQFRLHKLFAPMNDRQQIRIKQQRNAILQDEIAAAKASQGQPGQLHTTGQ